MLEREAFVEFPLGFVRKTAVILGFEPDRIARSRFFRFDDLLVIPEFELDRIAQFV
jgi:hypothetical protein